jgi:hypothetical protein
MSGFVQVLRCRGREFLQFFLPELRYVVFAVQEHFSGVAGFLAVFFGYF